MTQVDSSTAKIVNWNDQFFVITVNGQAFSIRKELCWAEPKSMLALMASSGENIELPKEKLPLFLTALEYLNASYPYNALQQIDVKAALDFMWVKETPLPSTIPSISFTSIPTDESTQFRFTIEVPKQGCYFELCRIRAKCADYYEPHGHAPIGLSGGPGISPPDYVVKNPELNNHWHHSIQIGMMHKNETKCRKWTAIKAALSEVHAKIQVSVWTSPALLVCGSGDPSCKESQSVIPCKDEHCKNCAESQGYKVVIFSDDVLFDLDGYRQNFPSS